MPVDNVCSVVCSTVAISLCYSQSRCSFDSIAIDKLIGYPRTKRTLSLAVMAVKRIEKGRLGRFNEITKVEPLSAFHGIQRVKERPNQIEPTL